MSDEEVGGDGFDNSVLMEYPKVRIVMQVSIIFYNNIKVCISKFYLYLISMPSLFFCLLKKKLINDIQDILPNIF